MDKNSILVSVVVPVYNVEQYLQSCIDSLLTQTYRNLEIILVDDGSTDQSGTICDRAAGTDPRIHVIHKKNGGISDARNRGLDQVHGEYVCFADSDDVYAPYGVECLLNACRRSSVDIVVGEYENFTDQIAFPETWSGDGTVSTGRESVMRLIGREHVRYTLVNNKLYRTELFRRIRFPVGMIHEDEDIMYRLLYAAKKVAEVHETVYGYRTRPNSITTSDYSAARMCAMEIARKRAEFFRQQEEPVLYANFQWVYAMLLLQHYPRVKKDLKRPDIAKKIKKEYFRIAPELRKSQTLSRRRKQMVAVFSVIPGLYARLMDWREKSIKNDRKQR